MMLRYHTDQLIDRFSLAGMNLLIRGVLALAKVYNRDVLSGVRPDERVRRSRSDLRTEPQHAATRRGLSRRNGRLRPSYPLAMERPDLWLEEDQSGLTVPNIGRF